MWGQVDFGSGTLKFSKVFVSSSFYTFFKKLNYSSFYYFKPLEKQGKFYHDYEKLTQNKHKENESLRHVVKSKKNKPKLKYISLLCLVN